MPTASAGGLRAQMLTRWTRTQRMQPAGRTLMLVRLCRLCTGLHAYTLCVHYLIEVHWMLTYLQQRTKRSWAELEPSHMRIVLLAFESRGEGGLADEAKKRLCVGLWKHAVWCA